MNTILSFTDAVKWMTTFFGRDKAQIFVEDSRVMPIAFKRNGIEYVLRGTLGSDSFNAHSNTAN